MKAEALVRKYEPVLRFAKGENFFPMNVQGYVPRCSLHVMEAGRGVMRIPPPFVDLQALAEFPSERHYLVYAGQRVADPEDEAALRRWIERQKTVKGPDFRQFLQEIKDKVQEIGIDLAKIFLPLDLPQKVFECALESYEGIGAHPPTYYYRIVEDGGYTVVQYWFFYAYNDFATSHGGVNDHEADWESAHLFFKGDEPVWTTYSSHVGHGKELGRLWDASQMEFEGDHPVIYVAAGSHANYHRSEAHLPDKAFVAGDVVVGDPSGIPWIDPEPMDKPWFTDFRGRWGSYQWERPGDKLVTAIGGAPTGPKFSRDGSIRAQWGRPVEYAGLDK
jgi:hypothetical protein